MKHLYPHMKQMSKYTWEFFCKCMRALSFCCIRIYQILRLMHAPHPQLYRPIQSDKNNNSSGSSSPSCIGFVFAFAGIAALFYSPTRILLKWIIRLGVICLAFTFYGFFVDKHYSYGTLFEYSAQFVTPILFLWYCSGIHKVRSLRVVKIAISLTFFCHGLFAVGYYPQPGNFLDMLIIGFRMQEGMARVMLLNVGLLDFIFAAAVFVPKV